MQDLHFQEHPNNLRKLSVLTKLWEKCKIIIRFLQLVILGFKFTYIK